MGLLKVGGWVRDFLQTPDSRLKGVNMQHILWPKAPALTLRRPDLLRAKRALGPGAEGPVDT